MPGGSVVSRETSMTLKLMPILENGDRLTRTEFERRYQVLPEVKKAELVEGVVYMASPVRARQHGRPHGFIMGWLMVYAAATPNSMVLDNTTVRLDLDNEPQPDALLRLDEGVGGQSRISEDDYIEGAPELIVEIAASTASYDLHDKLRAYRRNGVREYLVWVVLEEEFRWYVLEEGGLSAAGTGWGGLSEESVLAGVGAGCEGAVGGGDGAGVDEVTGGDGFAGT